MERELDYRKTQKGLTKRKAFWQGKVVRLRCILPCIEAHVNAGWECQNHLAFMLNLNFTK
jgi:hypothetical protein